MKKPISVTTITVQSSNLTAEQAQQMMTAIRQRSQQEQRDWEIYQKGVRAGSSGLSFFGIKIL